jgi:L-lactate permease
MKFACLPILGTQTILIKNSSYNIWHPLQAMIATVSCAESSKEETMSTLNYAQKTKSIVNKAKINEEEEAATIRELQTEIEIIRKCECQKILTIQILLWYHLRIKKTAKIWPKPTSLWKFSKTRSSIKAKWPIFQRLFVFKIP